jgi:orotidine-5'-phosphate decarboxylase
MTFIEKLETRQKKIRSLLCVGLDPSREKIPSSVLTKPNPIFEFNKAIIDAVHSFVCSFKPQAAYYGAIGAEEELAMTIQYIHDEYADIPVILDAKRSDIGSTAEMYAIEAFDRFRADAVTVNPYLGFDSVKPFTDRKDKGTIILCKTSNPSSRDFQDEMINGVPLFIAVAQKAQAEWNYNQNVLFVVGATYPSQMREIRKIAPTIPFLVPGLGSQGGSVKEVMDNGLRDDGLGIIISSSRAIIHASLSDDFAKKAGIVAEANRSEMRLHWKGSAAEE